MSYRTASSKRPFGDEWVQMQCDGCGALGPRVEVTLPRRGPMHEAKREAVLKLAKQVAGFTERLRPWRTASGRAGKGQVIDDLCRTCAAPHDPVEAAQIYRDYLRGTERERGIAADDYYRDIEP